MDDLVKQALAKWPDVPDCTGWLALDARGRWRIGTVQDGPRLPITHPATIAFINRNYVAHGRCWIFQNGPQRVYVDLEYTPFVWRLQPTPDQRWDLVAHTGAATTPTAVWLDDGGRFLVEGRVGERAGTIGVVHDHDTALLTDLLHDDDGGPLDDERITDLSLFDPDEPVAARSGARVHWATATGVVELPVRRIAAHQVAQRFGYEPKPSIAVRVDVDTRR